MLGDSLKWITVFRSCVRLLWKATKRNAPCSFAVNFSAQELVRSDQLPVAAIIVVKKKKKSCGSTCNASSALPSCFMLALLSNTGTLRQGKTSRRSLWPPLHFCRLAICLVAKVVSIISATWFTESYKEPARARHALHEERASINYKACWKECSPNQIYNMKESYIFNQTACVKVKSHGMLHFCVKASCSTSVGETALRVAFKAK